MTLIHNRTRELKLAWLLMHRSRYTANGYSWTGTTLAISATEDKLTASLTWMFEPTNDHVKRVAQRVYEVLFRHRIGGGIIDPIALDTAARCSSVLPCQLARAHFETEDYAPTPVRAKLVAFVGPVHRPVLTVTRLSAKSAKYPHRYRIKPCTAKRASTVKSIRSLVDRVRLCVFAEKAPQQIGASFGLEHDTVFRWHPYAWEPGGRTLCEYKKLGMAAREQEAEELPF